MNYDRLSTLFLVRKKFIKLTLLIVFFCAMAIPSIAQTTINANGTIIDQKGSPIVGATVIVLNSNVPTGTITNLDGKFHLALMAGANISISSIGYKTRQLQVHNANPLSVVLEDDVTALEEVVVVGYGEQKKVSVIGAISTTSSKDLIKSPVGSLGSAMAGRLNGLVSVQETGIPGGESPRLNIRGVSTLNDASPLVIIDGVERTGGGYASRDPNDLTGGTMGNVSGWESINMNDVESISVLKDASATAVYGVKGANGVIIITTKKGQIGKPSISYSYHQSFSQPTKLKEPLNAYETMKYSNEGNYNDGRAAIWDFDQMNKYRYHVNDFLYPDIDINDYVLKSYAPKASHNLSVSGGTDFVKYYVSLGYYDETGLIKNHPAYGFNPNNEYTRTNARTNLDFQFTKRWSASLNIDTRFEQRQGASSPSNNIFWTQMYMSVPWISPGFDDKNHYVISNLPTSANGYPIFVLMQSGGMYQREQITANTQFSTKYELDQVTKGLSVSARYAFDSYSESWSSSKQAHARVDIIKDPVTNEPIFMQSGYDGERLVTRQNPDKRKKYYFEASVNYARQFGNHNVTGLALYNQEKRHYFEGYFPDVPVSYMGFVGRITYDYKSRYFAELNIGINGSENFPPGKRFGVFPAYSVGWLLSEEPFLRDSKIVSTLKLRASYGEVGSDRFGGGNRFLYVPGNYSYLPRQNQGIFGEQNDIYGGGGIPGVQEGTAANDNVSWETAKKTNIGFDSKFFNNRLSLVVDIFQENRENILTIMETLPGFLYPTFNEGGFAPLPSVKSYTTPVNYAKVRNRGIEIELGWNSSIGKDFGYSVKLTMAHSKNKAILLSESKKEYPWLYNQGLPLQLSRGLIAEGYWNSYDEINTQTNPYNTFAPFPVPGDVRYRDVNGDMKIDDNDKVPFDYSSLTPRTTFAGNFGINYKNFDISVLLQGATGMIYMPSGFTQRLGQGGDKAVFDWISDRWTPHNKDGNYPRLQSFSDMTVTSSNFQPSTYWAYDNTYVRLKNLQIGYNLPEKWLKGIAISSARVMFTGHNLFTWVLDDKMKNYDPEAWSGGGGVESYYPIMKVYSVGLNVTF